MGLMGTTVTFMAGTAFGVYLCHTYDVPTFNQFKEAAIVKAKNLEETYNPYGKSNKGDTQQKKLFYDRKQQ
ncbi:hypothetical protein R3W88_002304 [Solanum pinnatisectum]|uniref:Uncharacterized protein n=1 Tax=Solanum pinnatisectum TaxID=50273 RepID=A0AAV9MKT7_9SOLN|nr:hypothetical protein R3W88_002304 [Solanum pinnatisectum]